MSPPIEANENDEQKEVVSSKIPFSSGNDAQQPPPNLPTSYANWSPSSHRRAMNPAGIARQISAPNPVPFHFNRPSPNSSPVLVRKNRNPSPAKPQLKSNQQQKMGAPSLENKKKSLNKTKNDSYLKSSTQPSSARTCQQGTPQKGEDRTAITNSGKKVETLANNEMPMHFTETHGQSAREDARIITTSSDTSRVQESVSGSATTTLVASSSVVHHRTETQSSAVVESQSFATERRVPPATSFNSTSSETSSVKQTSVCSQAPWRVPKEKQQVSESYSVSNMSSEIQQVRTGIQQQPQPIMQEAPWRSPQAKRKVPKPAAPTVQSTPLPPPRVQSIESPIRQHVPAISKQSTIPPCNKNEIQSCNQSITPSPCMQTTAPLSSQDNIPQHSKANPVMSVKNTPVAPAIKNAPPINIKTESIKQSNTIIDKTPPAQTLPAKVEEPKTAMTMTATVTTSSSIKQEMKIEKSKQEELQQEIKETEKVIENVDEHKKVETSVAERDTEDEHIHTSDVDENVPKEDLTSESPDDEEVFSDTPNDSIPPPPPPPPFKKGGSVSSPSAKNESHSLPSSGMPGLPFRLQDPEDEEGIEYSSEPITRRIQKFEKQSSFENENKRDNRPNPTPAKPVGPWVKKTSTGPVQQDTFDPLEGNWSGPTGGAEDLKVLRSRFEHLQQPEKSSNSNGSSSVKVVLSPPFKDQPIRPPAPDTVPVNMDQSGGVAQPKQIQNMLIRPRTRSTAGEYAHNYIENDDKNSPKSKPSSSPLTKNDKETPVLFDPWCDPNNPRVIQFQDVSAAAFKIKSGILNTPCTRSNISTLVHSDIYFKKEFNQFTGSFKERGARYTLLCLPEDQKKKGVIAASAGNHALALSYHGQDLGVPVTVVMPLVAPIMKVQACRQYGANILVRGQDIGECREIALKMAKQQDLSYINGYDHPHILAGQGTMGLEIVEQVPNIDAVVVPVGGGGLIAGVALAVKSLYPHIKIIGVESEKCRSFSAAMECGKPVYVKAESSLADGLAVPTVGVNAFATAKSLVDKVVSVEEKWIAIAILRLVEIEKAVVEGAGAVALAALLAGELPELVGKRVVIPLCGGNIDTTILGRCLDRGLAADGRLVKFTVTVSDRPGGIADLTRLLANLGVSIKDMLHERAWIKSDIFSVEVKCLCETRDYFHMQELKNALKLRYSKMYFQMPKYIENIFDGDFKPTLIEDQDYQGSEE